MTPSKTWSAALALSAALAIPEASANPMMSTMFTARQTPGTRHIQLTYLNVGEKVPSVASYIRDDKAYALKWKPAAGFKANLGSGVGAHPVAQACDCNVPLGSHGFQLVPADKRAMEWAHPQLFQARFEVVANAPDPARIPEKKEELPELSFGRMGERAPRGLQGLDCRSECSADSAAPLADKQPKDTAVQKEATITAGYFILEGRLVRPPYKLVLDNYRLTLNGEPLETWERFTEAKWMKEAFDNTASTLKRGGITARCEGRDSGTSPAKEAAVKEAFRKLDEMAQSKGDRNSKLTLAHQATSLLFSGCQEQLVDRWNGSN